MTETKKTRLEARKIKKSVQEQRQKLGLTQEELARRADLRLSTITKIEGGYNANPTLETLLALARVLTGGSIDALLK